jgi:vacuolar protein sorting-associated protein 1
MLELEKFPVFTQNTHYLESEAEKWLSRYSEAQRHAHQYHRPSREKEEQKRKLEAEERKKEEERKSRQPWGGPASWGLKPPEEPRYEWSFPGAVEADDFIELASPASPSPLPIIETQNAPSNSKPKANQLLQVLREAGYGNVRVKDLEKLRSCAYQEELVVMARVRAYFQVAYKVSTGIPLILEPFPDIDITLHWQQQRIIDYIPLAIEHELNQTLVDKLQESLFQTLLKEPEQMKDLLREDPVVSKRRRFLEDRTKRLVEIQMNLEEFRRGSDGGT